MKNPNFVKKMVRKFSGGVDSRQKKYGGPKETLEEFLARGGEITICPPRLAPDQLPTDPPRRLFTGKGLYEI
jgi:hypothetical protein